MSYLTFIVTYFTLGCFEHFIFYNITINNYYLYN